MDWLQRTAHPVLRETREIVEAITQNRVQTVTAVGLTTISPDSDLILADATAGTVVLAFPTAALWEKRITVIKTDVSANAVILASTPSTALTVQYQAIEVVCDGTNYRAVCAASSAVTLAGDVTGVYSDNTVSFIQNVPVDMVTTPPVEGARIIYHNGAIVPAAVKINPIDNRLGNAGLWSFDLSPSSVNVPDLSGNGNNLTVESGTLRTASIYPQIGGVLFDGATVLVAPSSGVLQITGAMTLSMLFFWSDLPTGGALRTLVSHGILPGTGASPTNYLYRWAMTSLNQGDYFTQHGANVASFAQTNSTVPRAQVGLVTITRDGSGSLKHYLNGIFAGSPFGTITLPTDGSSGRFRVGGEQGVVNPFTGVVLSIRVSNNVTADADILAEYNYTLGGVYGYR